MDLRTLRRWGSAALVATAVALTTTFVPAAGTGAGSAAAAITEEPVYPRVGQPTLYTRDINRMAAFYRDHLGFTVLYTFPGPDGTPIFATLQKGPFFVALATYSAIREFSGLPLVMPGPTHQFDIAILVTDTDATIARMRAAGVRVVMEPRSQPWGDRQAYVLDPEGNYVQISTTSED